MAAQQQSVIAIICLYNKKPSKLARKSVVERCATYQNRRAIFAKTKSPRLFAKKKLPQPFR
jgi:hypothetical protein